MIHGPYRGHASGSTRTPTKAAPWADVDERQRVSRCVHVAPRKPRGAGPCYFAAALEAALRAWFKGRKA